MKHVDLLGEGALLCQEKVHPGRVAVYPRNREPYTLLEEHQGSTVLNWNGTPWVVSARSHFMSKTGGMLRVIKDEAGYLRVSEHIDFGGYPLAYKREQDGSLLVLSSVGLVFDPPCGKDDASGLQLIRIRPDLTVESALRASTGPGTDPTEAHRRPNSACPRAAAAAAESKSSMILEAAPGSGWAEAHHEFESARRSPIAV